MFPPFPRRFFHSPSLERLIIASAPPPSLPRQPPAPQLAGRVLAAGGLLGLSLLGLRGGGLGRRRGGGTFAASTRPWQPAYTRPPSYSFDSSAAWAQEFGLRAQPRPISWSCQSCPVLSYARWCVLSRVVTIVLSLSLLHRRIVTSFSFELEKTERHMAGNGTPVGIGGCQK